MLHTPSALGGRHLWLPGQVAHEHACVSGALGLAYEHVLVVYGSMVWLCGKSAATAGLWSGELCGRQQGGLEGAGRVQ